MSLNVFCNFRYKQYPIGSTEKQHMIVNASCCIQSYQISISDTAGQIATKRFNYLNLKKTRQEKFSFMEIFGITLAVVFSLILLLFLMVIVIYKTHKKKNYCPGKQEARRGVHTAIDTQEKEPEEK